MSETAQPSSSTGSSQEHAVASKKIDTKNLTIYVAVVGLFAAIGLAVLLNYLGTLPLSEVYPGLSFLPRKGAPVTPGALENARVAEVKVVGDQKIFEPGLTTASTGKLVEQYTVFYTLRGKVTKVEDVGGGKYNLLISAFDGSQTYTLTGIGGDGILFKANKPLNWRDLKVGSDLFMEINVNSGKGEGAKPQIIIGQIQVTAAAP